MNLNQVTIYCENTTETAEFYKKLGLRIIVDSLPRYARFECPAGDSTLSVHETTEGHASGPSTSRIVLYFECSQLDTEVERLMSLGLEFDSDPQDREWLWREAYLKDPEGNKICLFYAGENRKNPPWRVN